METFLIKTVQLLLSLSILVIFHEFGHFIFARMFKVRVENFICFSIRGSLFSNSNLKIAIPNMESAGYRSEDM